QAYGRTSGAAPFPATDAAAGRTHVLRNRQAEGEESAMKYFTPELYMRLQDSGTAAMDAADAAWEAAEERYEQHLQRLTPALAPVLQMFDDLLMHDATVSSMSRRGDQLVIVLHTDARPREVVT